MTDAELEELLAALESDRVERKESAADTGRLRQAICAFSNDMPNHAKPGVLFIGAKDDGDCSNLPITDELLLALSDMRSDGNILPIPTMTVQKRTLRGGDVATIIVEPSGFPPVRYNGRVWIRVGPRRATASDDEERRLVEKRRAGDLPFDLRPITSATIGDLSEELFLRTYLPAAVAPDVLEKNNRTLEQQLMSLRFCAEGKPTVVGLLVVGKAPTDYIPGAYVQFLRIEGSDLASPIADQKECHGALPDVLRRIDDLITANVRIATDIQSGPVELRNFDYPPVALHQLIRNAVMHRNYETSNAPVRINWFKDRIEIQNPGGPFGQVTRANFGRPGVTDYRNPYIAEAMKTLGYVQRFGVGLQVARKALEENGNPPPEFEVEDNQILVTVRKKVGSLN